MDRRQATAYHEAGHAVVAHELGLQVSSVEVNGDGSGRCSIPIPGSLAAETAVYAAGAMAEAFKFGLNAKPSPNDTLGIRRVSREERLAAIERASQILQARWADVEELAARLLADPDGFIPLPFPRDFSNP